MGLIVAQDGHFLSDCISDVDAHRRMIVAGHDLHRFPIGDDARLAPHFVVLGTQPHGSPRVVFAVDQVLVMVDDDFRVLVRRHHVDQPYKQSVDQPRQGKLAT